MNRDSFGSYRKIDFSNMATLEDFDKELFRIFTGNHWSTPRYPYIDEYDHENGHYFLRMLKTGDVNIYEYEYEIPADPEEGNDYEKFTYTLFDKDNRGSQLIHMYWKAERFFNRIGYMINPTFEGMYKIDKYIKPPKKELSYREYLEYRRILVDENETLTNYEVRVGSLDIRRLEEMLFLRENNYLWVFPFKYYEEERDSKDYCYLIECRNKRIYDEIWEHGFDFIK